MCAVEDSEMIRDHLVLLGDSIFDNGAYVARELPVVEHLRQRIPAETRATLLAVDGHRTADVAGQLADCPDSATHLFLSVGGNDALNYSHVLSSRSGSLVQELTAIYTGFHAAYAEMLEQVLKLRRPTTVCTVYDGVPGLQHEAVMALSLFNDVILREAIGRGLPVIDLRLVCTHVRDYSAVSPIEPSAAGGAKIAEQIARVYLEHDFRHWRTCVFS